MDRPLADATVRRNRIRATARIALPVVAVLAAIALLPGWIRPSVTRAEIRTAVVTTGPIDAVITASGTVVPDIERVLSSPVDARLLRILKRPGAAVRAGEPVAELDLGESRLALERVDSTLAITGNKQDQARLTLERTLADVDARIARKELDVQMLDEKAASSERLADEGLVSPQALREARLAAKQAAIELVLLRQERSHAQRSTELQSQGLSLEHAALVKEAAVARRTLDLATTRSDRDGVVTWIRSEEGALVRRGDVVARIADLRTFRIEGTASDVHSGAIVTGLPARIVVNGTTLDGTVSEVQPSVEAGVIRFTVALQDASHRLLRPNMRVDVHLVLAHKSRTLKLPQGAFVTGANTGDVFVIRGRQAVRMPVAFGLRGADDVEVASGLHEGDEVIVSDMRDYLHASELEVR